MPAQTESTDENPPYGVFHAGQDGGGGPGIGVRANSKPPGALRPNAIPLANRRCTTPNVRLLTMIFEVFAEKRAPAHGQRE